MKKFNVSITNALGKSAGVTVNTTEDVADKTKEWAQAVKVGVPVAKDATKTGIKNKWGSIKESYIATRQGDTNTESEETIDTHVVNEDEYGMQSQAFVLDAVIPMLELTEGK